METRLTFSNEELANAVVTYLGFMGGNGISGERFHPAAGECHVEFNSDTGEATLVIPEEAWK